MSRSLDALEVTIVPKGGPRARSGPPPDPNALSRDRDAGEWVNLPASGRQGDPPPWPLREQSEREAELWAGEWRRPQAIMWEINGQELEVALYVRRLAEAELPDAKVTLATLVRQLQEALGVSLPGLSRNRWRIVDESRDAGRSAARRSSASARDRFKVVAGEGGG